jgi:hypothetical protein
MDGQAVTERIHFVFPFCVKGFFIRTGISRRVIVVDIRG